MLPLDFGRSLSLVEFVVFDRERCAESAGSSICGGCVCTMATGGSQSYKTKAKHVYWLMREFTRPWEDVYSPDELQ